VVNQYERNRDTSGSESGKPIHIQAWRIADGGGHSGYDCCARSFAVCDGDLFGCRSSDSGFLMVVSGDSLRTMRGLQSVSRLWPAISVRGFVLNDPRWFQRGFDLS